MPIDLDDLAKAKADALNPTPGMTVISTYRHAILPRTVKSVSESNIVYMVPAANGGYWQRNCLPSVWRRWCRTHEVSVQRSAGGN